MVCAANEAPDSEQEAVEDVNSFIQAPLEQSLRKYEAYDVGLSDIFLAEKPINCNSDSIQEAV